MAQCEIFASKHTHTHTHTRLHHLGPIQWLFVWDQRWWARARKVNPIWILLKQETVSGSGISWVICKSALRSRQITMPSPHHSDFTVWMPFLMPNEQHQSTEGTLALADAWLGEMSRPLWRWQHEQQQQQLSISNYAQPATLICVNSDTWLTHCICIPVTVAAGHDQHPSAIIFNTAYA